MGTVPVGASVFAVDLVFIITYLFVHVGTDPMGSGDSPCEFGFRSVVDGRGVSMV